MTEIESTRPDMTGWELRHKLRIPEPTVLLNRWQRMHWAKRSRYKKDLLMLVRGQYEDPPSAALAEARIHITRGNPPPRPDIDGVVGGAKTLLDCLTILGFIRDDNPNIMKTLTADSVITKRKEGFTEVEIWAPVSSCSASLL